MRLNGAAKKKLAQAVIRQIKSMSLNEHRHVFEECMEYSIYTHPENFIKTLGLDVSQALLSSEAAITSPTLSCVGYKNGDIADEICMSNMYQFANASPISRISL